MPPILNAQGLSKAFGTNALFRDISSVVSDGDRIGLIGPNGAGKSTLLQILAGEQDADAGNVAMRKRARIGYVRQESTFADALSIRDVLEASLFRSYQRANRGNHSSIDVLRQRSCRTKLSGGSRGHIEGNPVM